MSVLSPGHDVADARVHRQVAAMRARGLVVEVLGLGDSADGPAGAQVHTWPRAGRGLGRIRLAWTMARMARGTVLFTHDPDAILAAAAVTRGVDRLGVDRLGRLLQRQRAGDRRGGHRLVVDMQEDYAALLRDRAWASGPRGAAARALVTGALAVAARADLTVVADDHVPPLQARQRLVVRNEPDLTLLPGPTPPGPQPRALYIGDLRDSRGLFAMLEAIRRAANWELDLVGPVAPEDSARLQQELRADPGLSARVHLHGRMPPAAAWELARGAWVGLLLLNDTPAFRAAQPGKLYEYLACGLPVVTTDLPRPAELVRQADAGCIVPGGDAVTVGHSVAMLLTEWSSNPGSLQEIRVRVVDHAGQSRQKTTGYAELADCVTAIVTGTRRPGAGKGHHGEEHHDDDRSA